MSSGIIISNQSLVVQSVTRSDSGHYTCHVFNTEGEGVSNEVGLAVKCTYWNIYIHCLHKLFDLLKYPISDAPVCKKQRNEAFGVARQELVSVRCDVLSDPMENLKFEWIFSKGDEKLDMQQSQIR